VLEKVFLAFRVNYRYEFLDAHLDSAQKQASNAQAHNFPAGGITCHPLNHVPIRVVEKQLHFYLGCIMRVHSCVFVDLGSSASRSSQTVIGRPWQGLPLLGLADFYAKAASSYHGSLSALYGVRKVL